MSNTNYQKEFRKLKKLLKKSGFEQITEGNHPKFRHGDFILTAVQNCKDHRNAFKIAMRTLKSYQNKRKAG